MVWLTDPMVCPWTCWGGSSPPWRWPSWCPRGSCRWTWPRCVGASSSPRHTAWAPHSWEMYPPKLLLSLEQSRLMSSVIERRYGYETQHFIIHLCVVCYVVPMLLRPYINHFSLIPTPFVHLSLIFWQTIDRKVYLCSIYICGWADAVCPRSCGMSVHNDNNYLRMSIYQLRL